MKKFLATILAFGMLVWAGSAMATPVTFEVDGLQDSYVNLANINMYGVTSISAELADFDSISDFILNDNESYTIDFFTFSVTGNGMGTFDLEANLNFDSPDLNASGTGDGGWATTTSWFWGGTYTLGIFYWDNAVQEFTLADGNIISIALDDGVAFVPGSKITIHTTITNLGGAPVPEPSTILLMGSGLLGLVGYSRKRFSKKS